MATELEHVLVSSHKSELISYMNSHSKKFAELIRLAMADKKRYSWRASWMLWSCISENDRRIQKYIPRIIDVLPTKKDSHQRELLMVLQRMELNDGHEGCLFDLCTKIWGQTHKSPSVRFNAFKLMVKISKKHPDFYREMTYLARPQFTDSLSNTVKKSILKKLEGLRL